MKKKFIVKNSRDFNKIIKTAPKMQNKYFVIYYLPNNLVYDRFGISVGKKIGKAVIRNKYKRRMRNIIDIYKKDYNNCYDYIIILRVRALKLSYKEMKIELLNLLIKGAKDEK